MTYYVDNQPNHLTPQRPEYRALNFDVVARGEEVWTDPDDHCDPIAQTLFVRVVDTTGACDKREIENLISKAIAPNRCGCEHDCCGHRFGFARVTLLNMNTAEVQLRTSRNY